MDKIVEKLWKLAYKSYKLGEFPVSAIVYIGDEVISCGYNKRHKSNLTIDHAEIIAINKANKKLKSWRLSNACMIVTLEPCEMCKTVIKEARLKNVYYLVDRNPLKKQYKCTEFEKISLENNNLKKYKEMISTFFDNKR